MVRPALHVHIDDVSELVNEPIDGRDFVWVSAVGGSLCVVRLEGHLVEVDELFHFHLDEGPLLRVCRGEQARSGP